jgi:hypothetical protein
MKIDLIKPGSKILLSKSTRDLDMSKDLKFAECGLSKKPHTIYCVGRCGSGKSHTIESLIKEQYCLGKRKGTCFDGVFVFCPRTSQNSYEDSFIKHIDQDHVYDELNIANLTEVYEEVEKIKAQGEGKKGKDSQYYSLIIIDDMAVELRDKYIRKKMLKLLRTYRHLNCSLWIISQNYVSGLDKDCRDNIQQLIQFETGSLIEKERLWAEWFSKYTKKEFDIIFEYVFDKKFNFIQCDRRNDFKICKNFSPLQITCDPKTI